MSFASLHISATRFSPFCPSSSEFNIKLISASFRLISGLRTGQAYMKSRRAPPAPPRRTRYRRPITLHRIEELLLGRPSGIAGHRSIVMSRQTPSSSEAACPRDGALDREPSIRLRFNAGRPARMGFSLCRSTLWIPGLVPPPPVFPSSLSCGSCRSLNLSPQIGAS